MTQSVSYEAAGLADATGIPLEDYTEGAAGGWRADLGIHGFPSAHGAR